LARGFLGDGDLANAEAELAGLKKKYPQTAAVQTQLGALYALRGDRPAAKRAFEQALQLDPGDDDALADLLTIEVQSGQLAEARRVVDAYLEKTPNSSSRAVLAARMHFTAADPEGAERLLRRAIDLNPSNLSAYGLLGQLYFKQGRLEDARLQFEQAARRGTNAVAANTMVAIILQEQDKTDEARRRYEQIMDLDPHAVVAANNLAYLYVERGERLDEALKLAQVAKAQLPTEPRVDDTLGWIYFKKNLTSQAISLLQRAADADQANPVPRYHLGMAYLKNGDLQKARQSLEKALSLNSNFPGADEAKRALAQIRGGGATFDCPESAWSSS
jgi:Flp pilus assembly protein TadD